MSAYVIRRRKTARKREKITVLKLAAGFVCACTAGFVLGVAARMWDVTSPLLSVITSQLTLWFLICCAIAVFSPTPLSAGFFVTCFGLAMLTGYYRTARTAGLYYRAYIARGWYKFCVLLPPAGYAAWYAKGKGKFAPLLKAGIFFCRVTSQLLLFEVNVWDVVMWYLLLKILK